MQAVGGAGAPDKAFMKQFQRWRETESRVRALSQAVQTLMHTKHEREENCLYLDVSYEPSTARKFRVTTAVVVPRASMGPDRAQACENSVQGTTCKRGEHGAVVMIECMNPSTCRVSTFVVRDKTPRAASFEIEAFVSMMNA